MSGGRCHHQPQWDNRGNLGPENPNTREDELSLCSADNRTLFFLVGGARWAGAIYDIFVSWDGSGGWTVP